MGGIIGSIAWIGLLVNRHGTVGTNTETVHQLLQIRAVVLAVAILEFKAGISLAGILTAGFEGCRIIVYPIQLEVEFLDHAHDQSGHERRPIRFVQLIQGPSEPVIIDLALGQAPISQTPCIQGLNPVFQFVERLFALGQIDDQQDHRIDRRERFIAVLTDRLAKHSA